LIIELKSLDLNSVTNNNNSIIKLSEIINISKKLIDKLNKNIDKKVINKINNKFAKMKLSKIDSNNLLPDKLDNLLSKLNNNLNTLYEKDQSTNDEINEIDCIEEFIKITTYNTNCLKCKKNKSEGKWGLI
jgi:uncharacterized protein YjgD (DUF1641 family)